MREKCNGFTISEKVNCQEKCQMPRREWLIDLVSDQLHMSGSEDRFSSLPKK